MCWDLLLCRYAVKLLCDEAALGEAEDCAELSEYLQTYTNHSHIGREGEPDWNSAILDQTPNLFSIGKSQENVSRHTMSMHVIYIMF